MANHPNRRSHINNTQALALATLFGDAVSCRDTMSRADTGNGQKEIALEEFNRIKAEFTRLLLQLSA